MPNASKVKPASIYLSLFASRPVSVAYIWSIFVSCAGGTQGHIFRAASSGPLSSSLTFESKEYDVCNDPDLFLLLELGTLGDRRTIRDIHSILEKVAIPAPDDEYSYLFDGRTWVIKAIMRLSAYGIIRSRRLERMEDEIQNIAAHAFYVHELGQGWTITKFEG